MQILNHNFLGKEKLEKELNFFQKTSKIKKNDLKIISDKKIDVDITQERTKRNNVFQL